MCRSTTSCRNTNGTRAFIFILMYLNGASGAAPQQGITASDRPPGIFSVLFFFPTYSFPIYFNCASGAAPQQ
jgi:hypothetical protein